MHAILSIAILLLQISIIMSVRKDIFIFSSPLQWPINLRKTRSTHEKIAQIFFKQLLKHLQNLNSAEFIKKIQKKIFTTAYSCKGMFGYYVTQISLYS